MNGRSEHQGREVAEREAISWLLRLGAPEATEADWLALGAWLDAAPQNRIAFDRAERVSAELTAASAELISAMDLRRIVPQPRRALGRRPEVRTRAWRYVAGVAAAAAAAVLFVVVRPPAPTPMEVYQTAKGENRMLDLADGSHIHLNSASRLTVRLERKARYIELAEGEAAFDVAKDAARPFLIAAGERTIRVVGTEFDVLRHQGRLRVTVRRGIVAVQSPDAADKAALLSNAVLLKAGDQFEHQTGERVSHVRRVDADAAFAWRGGDLVYRDQPLDEVVQDLNRYFATPVSVVGPAANLRFSGVLVLDDEEAVVRRLQAFLPIAVDRGQDGVVLKRR